MVRMANTTQIVDMLMIKSGAGEAGCFCKKAQVKGGTHTPRSPHPNTPKSAHLKARITIGPKHKPRIWTEILYNCSTGAICWVVKNTRFFALYFFCHAISAQGTHPNAHTGATFRYLGGQIRPARRLKPHWALQGAAVLPQSLWSLGDQSGRPKLPQAAANPAIRSRCVPLAI